MLSSLIKSGVVTAGKGPLSGGGFCGLSTPKLILKSDGHFSDAKRQGL